MDYWTRGRNIGHGSSATVSLSTSHLSHDVFAVKSSELSNSQLLQREQAILSSMTSSHVVAYRGFDITRENNKLIYNLHMEYVPGGSLADVVRANGGRGGLQESIIARYTRQILQGLEYLHSNGLAHCDIKSSNILIGKSGAKIADFGCAKRVESEARPIGGTPAFMAPEVARGEEQGIASDIWALGCTVIEMARGGSPWGSGADPGSVLYRVAYWGESPEVPCILSEEAKDFLSKCLKRDGKERWRASELLKHAFVERAKEEEEWKSSSYFSPTSVVDQGFWRWAEESEESMENVVGEWGRERVRRLGGEGEGEGEGEGDGARARWEWEEEEKWMTVRENKKSEMRSDSAEKQGRGRDCCWYGEADSEINCRKQWSSNSCRHPQHVCLPSSSCLSSFLH